MNKIQHYQDAENSINLAVKFDNDTIWLTPEQMVHIFACEQKVIAEHLQNIASENVITVKDGDNDGDEYYDFDAILAVGYRVNPQQTIKFRQWVTDNFIINATNPTHQLKYVQKTNFDSLVGDYAIYRVFTEKILGDAVLEDNVIDNYLNKTVIEIKRELAPFSYKKSIEIIQDYIKAHDVYSVHHYTKWQEKKIGWRIALYLGYYSAIMNNSIDDLASMHAKIYYRKLYLPYQDMSHFILRNQVKLFFMNKAYEPKSRADKVNLIGCRFVFSLDKIRKKELINDWLSEIGQTEEAKDIVKEYQKSFLLLNQYDNNALIQENLSPPTDIGIELTEAEATIETIKTTLMQRGEASELFGGQKDKHGLDRILSSILQTFEGDHLYPSIEQQAAHLLYFFIKDHIFTDGNKRIAAFMFTWFLEKNQHHIKKNGEKKINDNALVTLVLLVAESDRNDKELMIDLIVNLIGNDHE